MKPNGWMTKRGKGTTAFADEYWQVEFWLKEIPGTVTPLYSAATIRKWLSEEISQQVFDAGAHCTGGWEDTYRAMIAAKLQELEGGE